ncbi:class I SAM-dependent methyltransferase [Natronoglycomyces albus]|uniref:Class I SAM-dependent methyltransferase n=1 Tax=Natronoglycomyces albus TaxID=2811108 RepID=A0A895XN66_9ACTN|nr:class I SAM-dependent methyltransferase [Natronoglycomyces albus]QSB05222.1 class I SAM-dependent methyltransferase [Natronoglycomyces albus]
MSIHRDTAYHGDFGDAFAAHAEAGPYNAHIDRPAMISLAGDVKDARILDVGCGAGHYAAALSARGATVLGVDGSESLLSHARARTGNEVELRRHDLERPFEFLEDSTFDMVLCALVYHHVRARKQLLAEFFRVLRPGGSLLMSTTHPAADWKHFGDSYFSHQWVDLAFAEGKYALHFQRMTFETWFGELLGAGFALEELTEPRPTASLRDQDPAAFEKLNQRPSFVAARFRRPS